MKIDKPPTGQGSFGSEATGSIQDRAALKEVQTALHDISGHEKGTHPPMDLLVQRLSRHLIRSHLEDWGISDLVDEELLTEVLAADPVFHQKSAELIRTMLD